MPDSNKKTPEEEAEDYLFGTTTPKKSSEADNKEADEAERYLGIDQKASIPAPPSSAKFIKDTLKEQRQMSWPKYIRQWEKDLDNLILSGASYGGSENPALQGGMDIPYAMDTATPEEMMAARYRTGKLGQAAEIGGAVVSPITRVIGAAGSKALPYVEKVASPLLSRIGIGAAEGGVGGATAGTLAGHDAEDIYNEAFWSSVIGGGIPIIGHGIKSGASFLSGKGADMYEKLFAAGRKGGIESEAANKGLKEQPSPMKKYYDKEIAPEIEGIPGTRWVDVNKIDQTAVDEVKKRYADNYGPFRGTVADRKRVEKIDKIVDEMVQYPPTLNYAAAFKQQLGEYTKPYSRKGKYRPSSTTAINISKAVGEEMDRAAPGISDKLETYGRGKAAYEAGEEMAKGSVHKFKAPAAVLASMAAGGAGHFFNSPATMALAAAATIGSTLAGSAKLGGKTAYRSGQVRKFLDSINASPSSIFAQIYLSNERERLARRRMNRGQD